MRPWRIMLGGGMLVALLTIGSVALHASPFVVFPKATELVSPDARFAVRSVDAAGAASDFVGTFHSLWLFELATGRSRKLCDYLGVASAAWSSTDYLIVTQYVGKRTSRTLVFSAVNAQEPVMLDKAALIQLVATELRPALRENDHCVRRRLARRARHSPSLCLGIRPARSQRLSLALRILPAGRLHLLHPRPRLPLIPAYMPEVRD